MEMKQVKRACDDLCQSLMLEIVPDNCLRRGRCQGITHSKANLPKEWRNILFLKKKPPISLNIEMVKLLWALREILYCVGQKDFGVDGTC